MSLVARNPNAYEGTIKNNGFFPDLDIAVFQTRYRIDNTHDRDSIETVIKNNMLAVNDELNGYVCKQQQKGYQQLNQVPAMHYGDQSELEITYEQAVYARVKSDLLRHFANYDLTRSAGERERDRKAEGWDYYARESAQAVRKILGKKPTRVKLI